jgi:hypothetical protein
MIYSNCKLTNQRRPERLPLPVRDVLFELRLTDCRDEEKARRLLAAVCASDAELNRAMGDWRSR